MGVSQFTIVTLIFLGVGGYPSPLNPSETPFETPRRTESKPGPTDPLINREMKGCVSALESDRGVTLYDTPKPVHLRVRGRHQLPEQGVCVGLMKRVDKIGNRPV